MYSKVFKMNSKDFSPYVHKEGVSFAYKYRKGLPDKDTMDGTTHVDLGKNKRTVTARFNPQTETIADTILNEYRSGLIFLTIDTGTFLSEPITEATKIPALSKKGVVTMYNISPLVFKEL